MKRIEFLEALKRSALKFKLVQTGQRLKYKDGFVHAFAVYHQTQSTALLDPVTVLLSSDGTKLTKHIKPSTMYYTDLLINKKVYKRIREACFETPGHDTDLRAQILDALKLHEIPQRVRTRTRIVKNGKHSKQSEARKSGATKRKRTRRAKSNGRNGVTS